VAKTADGEHGRSEARTAVVVEAAGLAEHHEFLGSTAFGRIEARRVIDRKTETDVRIFVLSRKLTPKAVLETAPGRWQFEKSLHWQRDVSFGEDSARNRQEQRPSKHRSHPPMRTRRRTSRSERGIADRQAETDGLD
jgi:predicted transposase YbfD/YdcC